MPARLPREPPGSAPTRGARPPSGGASARDTDTAELALGRYRLLERLGAGGFGVVWRARDELLHREVALKRVPLGPGGDSERAMREALVAARLCHPAIVALYEACARDGAVYLISELVEGDTLGRLIADQRLSDEQVLEVGLALAGALAHAHARGVIHRDIKPQNVLVPSAGEHHHAAAKLTDFGGASLAGEDVLTRTGDVLGTLAYMAPEQSEGREVHAEADLYSLALVLYEALCGTNPVRGSTPAVTARRIGRRVQPLSARRTDLPAFLADAVDRALSPAPEQRGSVADLCEALEDALEHGIGAPRAERRAGLFRRPRADTELLDDRDRLQPVRITRAREDAFVAPRWEDDPGEAPAERHRGTPGRPQRDQRGAVPTPSTGVEDWLAHADRALEQLGGQAAPVAAVPPARGTLSRRLWLGATLALACWQAIAGRPGLALALLAALLPAVLIGAEDGSSRIPAGRLTCVLAPLLGLAGLAGAFPAIAGQARGALERGLRGALGYWWLTLAAPLVARTLWLALPSDTPARASWEASVGLAAGHVVAPVLTLGVLFGALLWGAGAAVLPWVVRGRGPWTDAFAAGVWALALMLAQPALAGGLSGAVHVHPRGAFLGALLGAALAVAARALRGPAGRECA
jgi:hypothetical protein